MRPFYYVDYQARASTMQDLAAHQSLPIMARLWRSLHGYFVENPGKFAIAFPYWRCGERRHVGNVIRVFAEYEKDFEDLSERLKNNENIAPYITKSFFQAVEDKHIEGWMEYRRYRVPTRHAKLQQYREKCWNNAEEIPYLRLKSASNYNVFSMHIIASNGQKTDHCHPTSYGLSGESRFSLPVLP